MNIRPASTDDVVAISALLYSLTEKFVAAEFPARAAKALLVSMLPVGIHKLMQSGCRYHVAESDGRIIGVICMKDNKHLYHLFVAADQQRKGVARNLLQTAMAACREAGYAGEFSVNSAVSTQKVYEKLGFVAQPVKRTREGMITIPMVLAAKR